MSVPTSTGWNAQQDVRVKLQRVVVQVGAAGGLLWQVSAARETRLLAQYGFEHEAAANTFTAAQGHQSLVLEAARSKTPRKLQARLVLHGTERPLELHLIPLDDEHVLELCFTTPVSDSITLLSTIALAAFSHSEKVGNDSGLVEFWNGLEISDDFASFARVVVTELQRWTGAERVTLSHLSGTTVRVLAVSGVAHVDPRSSAVQQLAALAMAADATAIERHKALVSACAVEIWQLPRCSSVLIFEHFSPALQKPFPSPAEQQLLSATLDNLLFVQQQLAQARQHPARRWLAPLWGTSARQFLSGLFILGAISAALTLIQTDLVLHVTGTLRPSELRDIYAPAAGIVEQIHVAHGQRVEQGTPLLELRSAALDRDWERLQGELRTAQQQLANAESLSNDRDATAATQAIERATQIEELKVLIGSLQQQVDLLEKQLSGLRLESPLGGTVLTWEIEQLLQGRPVETSHRLLSVANPEGDWELEVLIPQADLSVLPTDLAKLGITFQLPGGDTPQVAEFQEAALELQLAGDRHELSLPVRAGIPAGQLPTEVRPGSQVMVQLQCGRSAVGYVWFHRAIDQIRSWWTFRWDH